MLGTDPFAALTMTEQMSVGAMLSRNGFAGFDASAAQIQTDAVFSNKIYLKLTVSAAWPSGNNASMVATVDPFFGDMTVVKTSAWDGGTFTNIQFFQLNSNVNLGSVVGLTADPGSGDTDPTTVPDQGVVFTPSSGTALQAVATWSSGLVVTATLDATQFMTLDQNVQTCTGLLQYATLLDKIASPAKKYHAYVTGAAGGELETQDVFLRFPSEFGSFGSYGSPGGENQWYGVNNAILIVPARGLTGNVMFIMQPAPARGSLWFWGDYNSNAYRFVYPTGQPQLPSAPFYYFARCLFAYGMPGAFPQFQFFAIPPGPNFIVSAKTAIRFKKPVAGAFQNLVNAADGTFAASPFAPPDINTHSGLLIFDPVALMSAPPAGYVLDPSGGRYFLESMAPFGGANYGSAEWDYV